MADLTAKQRANIERAASFIAGQGNKKLADSLRGIIGEVAPKRAIKAASFRQCAAGRDGDCAHKFCPQLRDGEPKATGRHCPLDIKSNED